MATYKKRGNKPSTKEERKKKVEEESTTAEVFNTLDEGASKAETWVADNQKYIYIIVGVAIVAVLGYLGWQRFIQEPKETEAANEMAQAQNYFANAMNSAGAERDSLYTMSLNGGEGKYGFLDIIENYGGTDAANLARYNAGFAYLHTGNYQEAINHLEDFKSDDEILAALAVGGIGDAFMQLEQPEEALDYYDKAASMRSNEFTTPKFLLKASITALEVGENNEAEDYLTKLRDEYPESPEAEQVPVYLGQAQANN
ncbi:MAG: tetratricopeptide repeat protein [Salegentibacter sp.]|uniref:TPR repeat-containing protein n=1 Tax=Salegentibacter flavus TaxID=287099 RepID=A0A1I5BKE2_9FLAO|nr:MULTISPECIES: tetratricopeptide repeat protein [Salegentibacter]MDR9457455.1 tetratricopeptide repeat protein [Salegentibacter sp.]SFN75059.1 TPR repeat-containing protein [Salegentibacter flavus]